MEPTEIAKDQADFWILKICKEIDGRSAEWRRIKERFPLLVGGALLALSGCAQILSGDSAELIHSMGQLAYLLTFGGFPILVAWVVRDRLRLKAIRDEDAFAHDDLAKRGYEYFNGRLYKIATFAAKERVSA